MVVLRSGTGAGVAGAAGAVGGLVGAAGTVGDAIGLDARGAAIKACGKARVPPVSSLRTARRLG